MTHRRKLRGSWELLVRQPNSVLGGGVPYFRTTHRVRAHRSLNGRGDFQPELLACANHSTSLASRTAFLFKNCQDPSERTSTWVLSIYHL